MVIARSSIAEELYGDAALERIATGARQVARDRRSQQFGVEACSVQFTDPSKVQPEKREVKDVTSV